MTGGRWCCVVEAQVLRRWLFLMEYLDICDNGTWIKHTPSEEAGPDETGGGGGGKET